MTRSHKPLCRVWWDREGIAWEYDPPLPRPLTAAEQQAADAMTTAHLNRVAHEQTHAEVR